LAASHEHQGKAKKIIRSKKICSHVTNGLNHYTDVRNTERMMVEPRGFIKG